MATTTEMIKQLRELTGAGVLDCKKTLDQTGGDIEQAVALLREKGLSAAAKKSERSTTDGRVEAYMHQGNRLAALVEVNCETDFVARTEPFIAFCHDLAMQVAATNPRWVSREDIPAEVIAEEKASYLQEIETGKKPAEVIERILEGKLAKFYRENCLLEQAFIRDEDRTIQQLLVEVIAKMGENIRVRRFARFQIGD
jgi:elongation factor Ts